MSSSQSTCQSTLSSTASPAFLRAVANGTTADEVLSDIQELDTRFRLLDTAYRTLEHRYMVIAGENEIVKKHIKAQKELTKALGKVIGRLEKDNGELERGRKIGVLKEQAREGWKEDNKGIAAELEFALERIAELEEQLAEVEEMNCSWIEEKDCEVKK